MTAQIIVAERREIGVICGPIQHVADRGEHDQRHQHHADAVHLRNESVLQGAKQRPGNEHRTQSPAWRNSDYEGTKRKAADEDQRERTEDAGDR